MPDVVGLGKATINKLHNEGFRATLQKAKSELSERRGGDAYVRRNPDENLLYDVIFINGCDYSVPHPVRYRVEHQVQQLQAAGLSVKSVESDKVSPALAYSARTFVIFRYPWDERIQSFHDFAVKLNRTVLFDIDDLVIDTCYTDMIKHLGTMSPDELKNYNDGVRRYGKTLKMCNSAITTTEALAVELSKFVSSVYVNRNVASDAMVYYSEKAIYRRDVLPGIEDENKVPDGERKYWKTAKEHSISRSTEGTTIGYFSGSITHNEDFEYILPALINVLKKRPEVKLRIMGELDIPADLDPFRNRIISAGFCDWKELPFIIADTDINIAPLTDTLFNQAKSENKWLEASLVKVPTVASNIGAFSYAIDNGETGLLCSSLDEWEEAIIRLIDDPTYRTEIGDAAYRRVQNHCLAVFTGNPLAEYLRSQQTRNVVFALPSLNTSGGVLVVLQHALLLQDVGVDVSLLDENYSFKQPSIEYHDHVFPVYELNSKSNKDRPLLVCARIDLAVATFWGTLQPLLEHPNIGKIQYFVQNFEPRFYQAPDWLRVMASGTYCRKDVRYTTMSKWCQKWLKEDYEQSARYVPNGIDLSRFSYIERDWSASRIRILVEGDSESYYKNVDEAFRIVDLLDPTRYEVWYMSYQAEPKSTYRVDRFLHNVPHDEVPEVYAHCHILLKTSILESFSYPPLEMMATGGSVVAVINEGNSEYLEAGVNCLSYPQGDYRAGADAVESLVADSTLRIRLRDNGLQTAQSRDWDRIASDIVELYLD